MGSLLKSIVNKLSFNNSNVKQTPKNKATIFDLTFETPNINQDSIWWKSAPKIHVLAELSRGSLSGPVQESKALVREMLVKSFVVEKTSQKVDLSEIGGLCGNVEGDPACNSLEELVASDVCKKIHIISNQDLQKTLDRITAKNVVSLVSAEWLHSRFFWHSKKHNLELACAIVYARKRQIAVELKASIKHYYVSRKNLAMLHMNYHVLAMNNEAWRNHQLMGALFDQNLPYVRLPLLFDALILPKKHQLSYNLGRDLLACGAIDIITLLKELITK